MNLGSDLASVSQFLSLLNGIVMPVSHGCAEK